MSVRNKKYVGIAGEFMLKISLFTLFAFAINYFVFGSFINTKSENTVLAGILIYGYFNSFRWLMRKIRQLK